MHSVNIKKTKKGCFELTYVQLMQAGDQVEDIQRYPERYTKSIETMKFQL